MPTTKIATEIYDSRFVPENTVSPFKEGPEVKLASDVLKKLEKVCPKEYTIDELVNEILRELFRDMFDREVNTRED